MGTSVGAQVPWEFRLRVAVLEIGMPQCTQRRSDEATQRKNIHTDNMTPIPKVSQTEGTDVVVRSVDGAASGSGRVVDRCIRR